MPRGVGIIGAGPGVAALHLPTLARLADRFRVVHVADAGSGRAAALAAAHGIRSSEGLEELLADPEVEVVAVCSPPELHAEQLRRCLDAGIHSILCEKPLATDADEARELVEACRAAGVALVVGTNHLHDSAWQRAKHALLEVGAPVRSLVVTVALPPNQPLHALVADAGPMRAGAHRGAPDLGDPEVAAAVVRQLVLGLGGHDLPAVRDLAPDFERVESARAVAPIGYLVSLRSSGLLVQLRAVMLPDGPEAVWRLGIGTAVDQLELAHPPAFVHDGSASVRVLTEAGHRTVYRRDADDGYLREWLALDALADGGTVEYGEVLDDALFAIAVADGAAARIREAAR